MKRIHLTFSCTAALLTCTANAAEVQLGLQGALTVPLISSTTALSGGGHLAGTWKLRESLNFRTVLEGNLNLNSAPSMRLDLDLLKVNGHSYYGAGVGSGLIFDMSDGGSSFPAIVLSPVTLLNAHGFVGRTYGNSYVEGILRLGPATGLGVRFGTSLR